ETTNYQADAQVNVAPEAVQILKTVLLLEKPYSMGYLNQLLQGDVTFGLRKDFHSEMETFGVLADVHFGKINNLISFLVREDFLEVANQSYGTLKVSAKGEKFLGDPQDLEVSEKQLRMPWYEMKLMLKLREIRKELASQTEQEPYQFFNNYGIQCIIEIMPQTEAELTAIPALTDMPIGCRKEVLTAVKEIEGQKEEDALTGVYTKAASPSHRMVKRLFIEGKGPEAIAKIRKLQASTVRNYLSNLHQAGEIDLSSWIEETVDQKVLHKVQKYFAQSGNSGLKVAHETLGVDYDTLKLCRLHAGSLAASA
ncbi:MAG: helix-turn-helix domain-containing protein, partial [Bacteroidota bacterium]